LNKLPEGEKSRHIYNQRKRILEGLVQSFKKRKVADILEEAGVAVIGNPVGGDSKKMSLQSYREGEPSNICWSP
jgi:hypothetical protein